MTHSLKLLKSVLIVALLFGGVIHAGESLLLPSVPQTPDPVTQFDIANFMEIGQAVPLGYTWSTSTPYFWSLMSGTKQIYRLNEHGWPVQLTSLDDGFDFFELNYGGDRAIVGASIGGSEQSQLYLLDTKIGTIKQLTHFDKRRYGSVIWGPDDQSLYYRLTDPLGKNYLICRLDLKSMAQTVLMGDTTGVQGNLYLADISQDGQSLLVYHLHSNVSNDLYLLDLESGNAKLITVPSPDKDVTYKYPVLLPDNNSVLLITNNNDAGVQRLAKLKINSGQLIEMNAGWLDDDVTIDRLFVSPDYRYVGVIVNDQGYMSARIRERESLLELPMPDELQGMYSDLYFGADSSAMFMFKGPTRAPDIWRWQMYDSTLEQLTYSYNGGVDRELFVEPELISFPSFDQLEIPAFLYLPPEYTGDSLVPFVIHAHGGPESQFQPEFVRNIQYLLLNGYGVMAVNPRGSSGYGSAFVALDDYQLRNDALKDYKAAADYLIDRGYTRPDMLAIRGQSYGGYVALAMITEYPNLFGAAIASSAISNFESFLENTQPYRRALREAEYGPLSDTAFLRQISPLGKADRIKTPVLIIHGENDSRVPISEARQMISAIQNGGGTVDSLIFPDEGHVTAKRQNIIEEYRRQVEFLARHLKGHQEPATKQTE